MYRCKMDAEKLEIKPSRAQLLRYEADILLGLGKLEEARFAAITSFNLVKDGCDTTEIGASRSIMAQVAWEMHRHQASRSMATKAAKELDKGGDPKEILQHATFFAFVEAHFCPRHAQIIANYGLRLCDQGLEYPSCRQRLKVIRDNLQDIPALLAALAQLDRHY